jgi:23S rRNA (pseudouridine1915-N3)-methyltransferase
LIHIVTIGKMKQSREYAGLAALCDMYLTRVQGWCPVKLTELTESHLPDAAMAQAEEARLLAPYLKSAAQMLLWHADGKRMDSVQWSEWIDKQRNCHGFCAARPWVWVIAGPSGPAPALSAQAHAKVSLSAMTFPHLLARVLVLEQLYRGLSLIEGTQYHK